MRLAKSSVVPVTGDLRPFWRVSGRVRNNCQRDISDVTFIVVVNKKDTNEQLDTSELILKGTTAANTTRGLEQDVHLRIAGREWDWNIYPINGRLGPVD